jgi:hypothetical protein
MELDLREPITLESFGYPSVEVFIWRLALCNRTTAAYQFGCN